MNNKSKHITQLAGINLLRLFVLLVLLFLGIMLWDILGKGGGSISIEFLFQYPKEGMTQGGIFPAVVGTVYVTLITTFFAIPFGIATAIYFE